MIVEEFQRDVGGIEGLAVLTPRIFDDPRGYFMETYNQTTFESLYGEPVRFVQDNQSSSSKGVIRGIHFQKKYPQGKLVRVDQGEVFDVAVDLRAGSETFGKWYGVLLSSEHRTQFYIPPGFGHGFLVLSDFAEFCYKVTDFYHPDDESGIQWNDPNLGIEWPLDYAGLTEDQIVLSDKDKENMTFNEFCTTSHDSIPFVDYLKELGRR